MIAPNVIGRTGTTRVTVGTSSVTIRVTIQNTRKSFGRTDCLITPLAGNGEGWVSLANITLDEPGEPHEDEGRTDGAG